MPDGRIDRVVMEHVDPSKREFIEEYDRRYPLDPDSPVGSPKVIRTGEPELLSDIPDEFWDRRRAGSRAAPADAGGRHRLGARGPHARARHGDRRHRARPQRVRPALHRGGPAAGAGPGRPLRAGDRQRSPAHGRPALARRPRGHRRGRRRRGDGPVGRRSPRLRQRRGRAAARLHERAGAAVRPAGPADLPLRDVRRGRQRDPARGAAGAPRAGGRAPAAADGALPPPDQRRGPLVAHPVHARLRRGRPRAARDQRDRGHHGHQARRAGPPLPGPCQPGARELARLPGDAARRGPARRPGGGGLVRGRRAERATSSSAWRSSTSIPRGWRSRARCRSAIRPTSARTPGPGACCGADARSSTARSRTSCSCRRRSTRSTWS